jgi:geranylgeranyl diphosphate synthase type II
MMAACELGAIAVGAPEQETRQLCEFSRRLGLAFQGLDDLLDEVGDEASAGKRLRKDRLKARPSLPSMLGIRGALKRVEQEIALAESSLEAFAEHAGPLRQVVRLLEGKLVATRAAWKETGESGSPPSRLSG